MLNKKKTIIAAVFFIVSFLFVIGFLLLKYCDYSYVDDNGIESNLFDKESFIEQQKTATVQKLYIESVEDWKNFTMEVNNGNSYKGYRVVLCKNLDFSRYEGISPVGTVYNPFCGQFCGEDHTLKNMRIKSDADYVGVFGVIESASIIDLSIENSIIESSNANGTGGIAGMADGCTIMRCVFQGEMLAEGGSVGGIAGDNWSSVIECCTYGIVDGTEWGGSRYNYKEHGVSSYGTGGICGDNCGLIYHCVNQAEVSVDDPQGAGGISGYNCGAIVSSTNFGSITGGGIVRANKATITGCINSGNAYSGIAISCFENGCINYCINIGKTNGRYAADIASFLEPNEADNDLSLIKSCLYLNTSGNGPVAEYEKKYVRNNSIIRTFDQDKNQIIDNYITENDYIGAYNYIVQREKAYIMHIIKVLIIAYITTAFIIAIALMGYIYIKMKTQYKKGKALFDSKEYWNSFETLYSIPKYKDSLMCMQEALSRLVEGSKIGDIVKIGTFKGSDLIWKKVDEDSGYSIFVSVHALLNSRINDEDKDVLWEETSLCTELNNLHKHQWLGDGIDHYLLIDISIIDIADVSRFFPSSEHRKCKMLNQEDEVISTSGNVYWWLKCSRRTKKMPFVTGDGLISKQGRSVDSKDMGVRPLMRIKVLNENNY